MALKLDAAMPPVAERHRLDRQRRLLVGSRCSACGATSWPGRSGCQRCGRLTMEPSEFPGDGVLVTFTTVWVERPGLKPPYTLGQVKLENGPLVFAHVRRLPANPTVPMRVHLVVADHDSAVPPFWFEPEEKQ